MNHTSGEENKRTAWGEGRIAFLANKAKVQSLLNDGWPVTKVYSELQPSLGGLTYSGFVRCIRKHLETSSPIQKQTRQESSAIEPPQTAVEKKIPVSTLNDASPLADSELF